MKDPGDRQQENHELDEPVNGGTPNAMKSSRERERAGEEDVFPDRAPKKKPSVNSAGVKGETR